MLTEAEKRKEAGKIIKELRKGTGRNWSLEDLGSEIETKYKEIEQEVRKKGFSTVEDAGFYIVKKVSAQYLGQIERGTRTPGIEILKSILTTLKCSLEEQSELFSLFGLKSASVLDSPQPPKVALEKKYTESWIVSSAPIEFFDDDLFVQICKDIMEGQKTFSYWMTEYYVVRFWTLLRHFEEFKDHDRVKEIENFDRKQFSENIKNNIRCIVGPPELGWFNFAIYDPRTDEPTGWFVYTSFKIDDFSFSQKESEKREENGQENEDKKPPLFKNIYHYWGEISRTELITKMSNAQIVSILSHLIPVYENVSQNPGILFNNYQLVYPITKNRPHVAEKRKEK